MLTSDHRDRLRRSFDCFLGEDAERAGELHYAARELGVIPITGDRQRDFGIRLADGKVVSFSRNEPFELRVIAVPNARLAVLGHAWTKFPELVALVPTRPADAMDCPACRGSGSMREKELPSGLSCYCGGLGWLFADGW